MVRPCDHFPEPDDDDLVARREAMREACGREFYSDSSAAAVDAPVAPAGPLATLLTTHILPDGERVLMAVRPSRWFIILSSLPFAIIAALAVFVWSRIDPVHPAILYWQTAICFIGVRVMYAILQWVGRLYVLTDNRIMRFTGIFATEIYDCPLRKINSIRLSVNTREYPLRLGTIHIDGQIKQRAAAEWQMIRHPQQTLQRIENAIRRSKQRGRRRMAV